MLDALAEIFTGLSNPLTFYLVIIDDCVILAHEFNTNS